MNAVSPQSELSVAAGLPYLPVFFGLRGRKVLLIGGGEAAAAKLDLLSRAGARVDFVREAPEARHFSGAVLAIDASDDFETNRRSVQLAREAGVPINVVDRPALCDFILPAILDRAPVIVAVSTGGLAPAIARLIRQRLELAIPHGIGRLATLASRLRHSVGLRLAAPQRMQFWERLFDGEAARLISSGQTADAAALAETLIDALESETGTSALHRLGIDSADPELLTVRAARLIRTADVIFHEPQIASGIIELARRDALKLPIAPGEVPATRPGRVQVLLTGI